MNELIRKDLISIFLAGIVLTVGLIALGLSFFRLKSKEFSLLSFGAFTSLYGIRWLIKIQTIEAVAGTMAPSLLYVNAFSTYLITIPFFLFFCQIFGKGKYNSVQWVFRSTILFAAAGISSDIIQGNPFTLGSFTPVLTILWICITVVGTYQPSVRKTNEMNVLLTGLSIFILFVINSNLVSLNLLPWNWRNEEFGFLFLVFALGYVAAERFFTNEKKLLSVELEMNTAREIQSSILPQSMPSIKGLDIAARYIPMSAVAGDFYDYMIEDDKRVCILVADVSGHGVGAALIGSMLKVAFASQAEHISNPASVLEGINQILYGRIEDSFVTACCLFIDIENGNIRYANAGHPPSLLLSRPNNEISNLEGSGTILGPFPGSKYKSIQLLPNAGCRILMYTDGIIEASNNSDEFYGDERMKNLFKTHSNLPASEFLDKLIKDLYTWSGKPSGNSLDDDLTILVVDVLG